jgi:hypothetical protein
VCPTDDFICQLKQKERQLDPVEHVTRPALP